MKRYFLSVVLTVLIGLNAHAADIRVKEGGSIQEAVNRAQSGDFILVEPGRYVQSVYIDKPNITLKGMREGEKFAELDGEMRLNDGIIASGHGVVIEGFKVTGYKGNGIMTQGANNFKILNNFVTGAFYGIFPQYGKNGLVKGNTVTGAEDAGIYVGMSDNIDVIGNIAYKNVMGLELENSRIGLMADNEVFNNSTGIVLSLIPGLPVKTASDLLVRNNVIKDNNLPNFAPPSSIAASVPEGVGIIVVGPDNVTIVDNLIENHKTTGLMVSDIYSFGLGGDSKVDPYPENIRILENDWGSNGDAPFGILGEIFEAAEIQGVQVFTTGKELDSCIAEGDLKTVGLEQWKTCDPGFRPTYYDTAMLANGADEPVYTAEQKGRLTYLAVCTGCHTYNSVLHGPSMQSIQALYGSDVEALVKYIEEPIRRRPDFPEMPAQGYLGDETLRAIAQYILFELEN